MKSQAATPDEYLAALPDDRRPVVTRLRAALRDNLPDGFVETMGSGMIAYVVPHSLFTAGYHCNPKLPLPFINLASQKQYVSLYHMGLVEGPLDAWLRAEWPQHSAAKLDLGRCCLRFKKLDAVPYDLVAALAAKMTPAAWIAVYQAALPPPR